MLKLNELRKRAGYNSQQKLADKLGVSRSAVAMWESGASEPSIEMIIRIVDLLGTTSDSLLGIECEKKLPSSYEESNLSELDIELVEKLLMLKPDDIKRVKDFIHGITAARAK